MTDNFTQKALRFLRDEDGPAAVEYALMLGMIILTAFSAIVTLGESAAANYQYLADDMPVP
ncbi:MAG: Flp family type IVb pilin [Planctomycetota bacterium]|nr:Flp family type IVb pilin [Planctomycetota bacterium]